MTTRASSSDRSIALQRLECWGYPIMLVLMALFLGFEIFCSLAWRMSHDTPLLHYVAYLIDQHGFIPYVDVFETSFPGTLLFHLIVGKLFGYGDFAFRVVDITLLLSLLVVIFLFLKQYGVTVAAAGSILYGLCYMQGGANFSLQRDYIGVLPLAVILLLLSRGGRRREWSRAFWIGLLAGFSFLIKPHLIIGMPFVLAELCFQSRNSEDKSFKGVCGHVLNMSFIMALGFLLPVFATAAWLFGVGAWSAFVDMVVNYLPLHVQIDGHHRVLSGEARTIYLLRSYLQFDGRVYWLIPAAVGLLLAFTVDHPGRQRRFAVLLGLLSITYSIYPVLSGQFYRYHWMPFQFFIALSSALIFIPLRDRNVAPDKFLYPLMSLPFILYALSTLAPDISLQIKGKPPRSPRGGRVDAIVASLDDLGLVSGDQVQPLDWARGAIQALLISKVAPPTPYIYEYHFYHHVAHPFIQKIRKDYIQRLREQNPRFIVHVTDRLMPSGEGTSQEFEALWDFISAEYYQARSGAGFVIYERHPEVIAVPTRNIAAIQKVGI